MIYQSKRLFWNEVLGDPYTSSLSPLMLVPGGYSVDRLCRTVDSTEKRAYSIIYDRDYVYSYVAKKILKSLQIQSKEEAKAFIEKAWDYYERSWSQEPPNK